MPFHCRSPRRPLQHRAKAASVFVRRTFSYICPCGNKVPEGLQRRKGLAGFHPPFPRPLAAGPLQHCTKATSVFVRRTFSYMPLRKQSSRGTPTGRGISRISSAFSLPLAAEALATLRKSHVGLRPPHFFIYAPAETKFPKNSNGGRGLAGFHPPFPRPLAAGPLQHCAKAASVFVRRTFSYISPYGNKVPEGLIYEKSRT